MSRNDQAALEHIQALETDNDHLRAELEVLTKEHTALKIAYRNLLSDKEATQLPRVSV